MLILLLLLLFLTLGTPKGLYKLRSKYKFCLWLAVSGKLSCRRTALKCCTKIEILRYLKLVSRLSSIAWVFQRSSFQDHRGGEEFSSSSSSSNNNNNIIECRLSPVTTRPSWLAIAQWGGIWPLWAELILRVHSAWEWREWDSSRQTSAPRRLIANNHETSPADIIWQNDASTLKTSPVALLIMEERIGWHVFIIMGVTGVES